jgi:hypothetical protein
MIDTTSNKEKRERPSTAAKMREIAASKTIKKTITSEDSFRVNDKFRSNMKRLTINSI